MTEIDKWDHFAAVFNHLVYFVLVGSSLQKCIDCLGRMFPSSRSLHIICVCEGGELHFLQIGGVCDDGDDGDMFIDGPLSKGAEPLLEGAKPSSNPSSPGITGTTAG